MQQQRQQLLIIAAWTPEDVCKGQT